MNAEQPAHWCGPHLERVRVRIAATRIVEGVPMCRNCFAGRAIRREEKKGGTWQLGALAASEPVKRHFVSDRKVALHAKN
jgi:hypothetical protein